MNIKNIKNGSLYFNKKRNRVERVRSKDLNNSSVVVTWHSDQLMSAKMNDLNEASTEEVSAYLEESENERVKFFV